MRRLRTYEHMAQKMYKCDNCNREPIFPGDIYRGEVFAHNRKIIVKRYHDIPHCSDLPDPEEVYNELERIAKIETIDFTIKKETLEDVA